MDKSQLLSVLPPYHDDRDIIVPGRQKLRDIIKEVLDAHIRYASHYDRIVEAGFFDGGNACEDLFNFCQGQLKYIEEPREDQTTRSPAGIIQLSDIIGVDCKHYAGFIAGVLDALNRHGAGYNWQYWFVSYEPGKAFDHVFVVCDGLWLDPAPVKDIVTERYYPRSFDDRMAMPESIKYAQIYRDGSAFKWDIQKIPNTMLSTLSGINYVVVDENFDSAACGYVRGKVGCPNRMGALVDFSKYKAGTTSLQKGLSTLGTVQATAGQLADLLPAGPFASFLKGLLTNPTQAIVTLIKGRTYTYGGYQLGEMFMRNILGMSEIQSNWQVPDEYVPLAEQFFTLALGLEIGSGDHMNELVKSADAYYAWMPANVDQATPRANAERASQILKMMNYGWAIRDKVWPLKWFEALPYVYPMPDVEPGTFFTGTHPISGVELSEGIPVQVVAPPPPGPVGPPAPIDPAPPAGGGNQQPQPPPPAKTAGFAGLWPLLALGGIALVAANSPKPKPKRRSSPVTRKKSKRKKSRR